ncbi:MAG TPA: glycoside hydrolase family 18 protein [Terriglobales bacterium]|nr:glycoside hydrolase family 18 protein [Terriglobales bacterium]
MKGLKGGLAIGASILVGLLLSPLAKAQTSEATAAVSKLKKRLVADYGYWSKYQTPKYAAAQIPYGMLTHINHAGVNLNSDGTLAVPPGFLEPALLDKAHKAGVKVLVLLGGDFPALATPGVLDLAVGNLWTFVSEKGYDGVDIDWEFPETAQDRKTFLALMTALREVFPRPTYTLSADIPPWGGSGYDLKGVEPHVDYYNIMMYDCAGPWTDDGQLNSPIFWDTNDPEPWECQPGGSAQGAIHIFEDENGILPAKMNMGTPFYGYVYTNVRTLFGPCANISKTADGNCDYSVLTENYGTYIKQRINQLGWHTLYDPIALVPYMLRTNGEPGFITYDDSFSTYYRTWYSDWVRELGGTFMWSLDADYDGHTQDLLEAEYSGSLKPAN